MIVGQKHRPGGYRAGGAAGRHESQSGSRFRRGLNPEFLREGSAIADFMRPDRVILGVESPRAEALLRELYRPLNLIEAPILVTNLKAPRSPKHAANAFLATKISFINEISQLREKPAPMCTRSPGHGLTGRIGRKFLHAGRATAAPASPRTPWR